MKMNGNFSEDLKILANALEGELFQDTLHQIIYATDASAYREKPLGVTYPRHAEDIKMLVAFAKAHQIPLIPRGAGTSLAGQVVGKGLVVDVSRHMNKILEVNKEERWVRLEPGVVLDELNQALKPYGLFFGPETSTANRCVVGGMLGNNACGLHSLVYGSTRDHTLKVKVILSDGEEVLFQELTPPQLQEKMQGDKLENRIYKHLVQILEDPRNQEEIRKEYPHPAIPRRNTGYALDRLLECVPFTKEGPLFNVSRLLAGSEGTLAFTTEITLNLVPLPPAEKALMCVHCRDVEEALVANLTALKHQVAAIELMDKTILDLTKDHLLYKNYRFFLKEDPGAILIIELLGEDKEEIQEKARKLEKAFRHEDQGFHYPLVWGADISKVWALRKAGLGLLSNMPGDARPVSVVEDTAVYVEYLPQFIKEFKNILAGHGKEAVYHAHIATGELHLRPILNLKDPDDVRLFRTIATETAYLVKKYKGSLSGEHGDGRLRGEFIPIMIGTHNYELLCQIKKVWDVQGIFNPGKITDTPRMDTSLRYEPSDRNETLRTYFNWEKTKGVVRAAEKCNGSGDCRKSELIGGMMCPSFMATRDEKHTTRARANLLRDFLIHSSGSNPFDHKDLYEIMDLCLSCKGCKKECPSSVDMARLKAEFLQHYYDANGVPLRSRMIAYFPLISQIASKVPRLYNLIVKTGGLSNLFKRVVGFAPQRTLPEVSKKELNKWYHQQKRPVKVGQPKGKVYLFSDEFIRFSEAQIGIRTILLLTKLGYEVVIPQHGESGRTFLSKGLLKKARKKAIYNVTALAPLVNESTPLVGIEPSAILSFRDEYPDLVGHPYVEKAKSLARHALTIEEFLWQEMEKGNISKEAFTKESKKIKYHAHCFQKALGINQIVGKILSFPENYMAYEIPSGCCGMAGSFGYEKEHYDVSMKVGELVLFPEVRKTSKEVILSAPGTSCRQQIKDGTGREALHPVEVLYQALV